MKTYLYTCQHCYKEFIPTRRGIQKFCSDSCRSSHHQCDTRLQKKMSDSLNSKKGEEKSTGISLGGIGNAALGTAIVDTATRHFTAKLNRPATKGDLIELSNRLSRYVRIVNIEPNYLGQRPYLEIETGNVIYRYW